MSHTAAVKIDDVVFRYFKNGKRNILDHVSLTIDSGKITVIAGSSGCGKSTLAAVTAGLYPENGGFIDSGRIEIFGEDLSLMKIQQRTNLLSMMFQNPDLQFCMNTLRKEMRFCLENIAYPAGKMDTLISQSLQTLHLEDIADRKFSNLSGGEKQKAALACLFVLNSRCIILDESFANLDFDSAQELMKLVVQMKQQGRTIIAIDHKLDLWTEAADEIIILGQGGKVIQRGINKTNLSDYRNIFIEEGLFFPEQNKTSAEENIVHTRNNLSAEENIVHTQNNLSAEENIVHTQNNSSAKENNIHTQNNSSAEENIFHTQNNLSAEENIVHTQNNSSAEENIIHTQNISSAEENIIHTRNNLSAEENIIHTQNIFSAEENIIHTQDNLSAEENIVHTQDISSAKENIIHTRNNLSAKENNIHTQNNSSAKEKNPPVITLENLSIKFKDRNILNNTNAVFEKGKMTAILGHSGAGKTTTFYSLLKQQPYKGDIYIEETNLKKISRKNLYAKIGIVFQNPENQFISQNVLDEVYESIKIWNPQINADELQQKAEQLLESFGLFQFRKFSPYMLSQGQQRRLAVLSVLSGKQDILLLDEPTYGQDLRSTQNIMKLLQKKIDEEGLTVIFVTHDRQLAHSYADKIYELRDCTFVQTEIIRKNFYYAEKNETVLQSYNSK